MAQQMTDQNKVLLDGIADVENISSEGVVRLVGILKFGNCFVTAPDWYFLGISIRRVIATRDPKINKMVFRGSLRTREIGNMRKHTHTCFRRGASIGAGRILPI